MPYPDLQSFVEALQQRDQLRRISVEVDPLLEIAEIADRVSKSPAAGDAPPPAFDRFHSDARAKWRMSG